MSENSKFKIICGRIRNGIIALRVKNKTTGEETTVSLTECATLEAAARRVLDDKLTAALYGG